MISTIHQVELSSRCNLRCQYCPHPKMTRPKMDMSGEIFDRTIEVVKKLGGPELSFTGMGEALLHPEFVPMIRYARQELPDMWFLLSTNGICINKDDGEIINALRDCEVTVFVSTHRPEVAGKAVQRLDEAGIKCTTNTAFVTSGFDWAGQVKWHGIKAKPEKCKHIAEQWGCVQVDGSIVSCCLDAHQLYPIGHINDPVLPTVKPIPLCASCHFIP